MKFAHFNRTIHKWASVIIALPLLLVIVTGILLLVRKEFAALQPPSQTGMATEPSISFEQIIQAAQSVKEAEVSTWEDIDRLDVRPSKGIIKIRAKNSWEIQIDATDASVLQKAYRRSEWIESLHDTTFFQRSANLWLMLPVAIILLALWLTGMYLFFLPYYKRWRRNQ